MYFCRLFLIFNHFPLIKFIKIIANNYIYFKPFEKKNVNCTK